MDPWQSFRMALAWPLIVAATAAITAAGISRLWDNSALYWLYFTVGLFGAAAVMWVGIMWVALDRVRSR